MTGSFDDEHDVLSESADNADYQAFLDDYSNHFRTPNREVLQGRVLSVSDKEVIVDIGRKIEGLVPASQFPLTAGKPNVKPNDQIEVMFDRTGDQVEGYILLSYERAHQIHIWDDLEKALADGTPVNGTVLNRVKGGLAVDIGVIAFLPSSQIEIRPQHNLDSYLGKQIEVRLLKLNKRRGNAVVSHRVLVEKEQVARKAETLERIAEGAEVVGVVKNLTEYGAFVDLGGVDGLLHVSDLSYGNVTLGADPGRRSADAQGAEVRQGEGAHLAGAEANASRSLVGHRCPLSGAGPGGGPDRQCDRLWRLCGAGAGC